MRSRGTRRCVCCDLPEPLCLGDALVELAPRTRVVLVVHHVEVRKPSNTGRLCHKMLRGSVLRVRGLRDAVADDAPPEGRRLVLFPTDDARVLTPEHAGSGAPPVLLVPDGNWNQAKHIVRRDPWFRDAEAVRLPHVAPSRYGLRRNAREGTVCTLEAVAHALAVLEGDDTRDAMLAVLDAFVARARAHRRGRLMPAGGPRAARTSPSGPG